MSYAYKCDICGALYESHKIKGTSCIYGSSRMVLMDRSFNGNNFNEARFDICPDCLDAIKATVSSRMKYGNPFEDDLK
jgi:DNA-directed RNA polymerase subunit RPC12/RpoP